MPGPGAISVIDQGPKANVGKHWDWLHNPCICTLKNTAARPGIHTLPDALSNYGDVVERRIEKVEHHSMTDVHCAVCGNAKLVQGRERQKERCSLNYAKCSKVGWFEVDMLLALSLRHSVLTQKCE